MLKAFVGGCGCIFHGSSVLDRDIYILHVSCHHIIHPLPYIPRHKTLLPSNLHPPPPTIAFNVCIQAIVDGGGCRFEGSSVLGGGVRRWMDDMMTLNFSFS